MEDINITTTTKKRGNPNFAKKDNVVEKEKVEKEIIPVWKPDLRRQICVRNMTMGKLIYSSKKHVGYTIVWDEPSSENYIELEEFISLKNTDKRFVSEPWIRIIEDDEAEILKYCNIYQFYKNIIDIETTSQIFELPYDAFVEKFKGLPNGYKDSVLIEASEAIRNGTLDSIRIKTFLEKETGMDLNLISKRKNPNDEVVMA